MPSVIVPSYLTREELLALESKTTTKRGYFNVQIYAWLTPIFLVFTMLIWGSCGSGPFQPVSEMEEEEIKVALENRSFRQFDPDDIDASPRKAVILDFFDGVRLWAQYSRVITQSTSGRFSQGIIVLKRRVTVRRSRSISTNRVR